MQTHAVPPRDKVILTINRVYHELTAGAFDDDHHYRHRVERVFWKKVGRQTLSTNSPNKKRVIVDLACGTGFVGQCLKIYLTENDRLLALDLGHSSLKNTHHNWLNNPKPSTPLSCLAGDGQKIPLADESVYLLTLNAALHHLSQPEIALAEIDRVLQPGGWFALGHEPNRKHFACPTMTKLSRGLEKIWWYTSPRQNKRRMIQSIHRQKYTQSTNISEKNLLATMNEKLLAEGAIHQPMPLDQLLDLVDPHARGAHNEAGFIPQQLLAESLPGYEIHMLQDMDYLGQTARYCPTMRILLDGLFRLAKPGHGSLFCWLVRKPMTSEQLENN
jgi:ubiquinone/menaquinone biosynthesis C-methylase UbiE